MQNILSNIFVKNTFCQNKAFKDHNELITKLYQNTGLNKSMFSSLYLDVLSTYFKNNKSVDKEVVLNDINAALRARKGVVLPVDIDVEELHKVKDVWTYAVFLMGLLIHSPDIKTTEEILKKPITDWLKDLDVLGHLNNYITGFSSEEVQAIKSLYDIFDEVLIVKDEAVIEDKNTTGHKQNGESFYSWLIENKGNGSDNILIQDLNVFVKSPQIFIEFSKGCGIDWKSAQKGFYKLKKHQLNEINEPFHKINKSSYLLVNI